MVGFGTELILIPGSMPSRSLKMIPRPEFLERRLWPRFFLGEIHEHSDASHFHWVAARAPRAAMPRLRRQVVIRTCAASSCFSPSGRQHPAAPCAKCRLRSDLFDHRVSALLELRRYIQWQFASSFQIDHELELDRCLDGEFARIDSSQDAIGVARRTPKVIENVASVRQ